MLKLQASRKVFTEIKHKYPALPFTVRYYISSFLFNTSLFCSYVYWFGVGAWRRSTPDLD